jgi:hypothetical protein
MSDFSIVIKPNMGSMYTITRSGSGSLPAELRGMYTSPTEAKKALDVYEHTLAEVEKLRAVVEDAEKARRAKKAAETRAKNKVNKEK